LVLPYRVCEVLLLSSDLVEEKLRHRKLRTQDAGNETWRQAAKSMLFPNKRLGVLMWDRKSFFKTN